MHYHGKVKNGVMVLEDPKTLPEGAEVTVHVVPPAPQPDPEENVPNWEEFQALIEANDWRPTVTQEVRKDLDWLVDNPEQSLWGKYHDSGACWQLIEASLKEIRRLRRELRGLAPP